MLSYPFLVDYLTACIMMSRLSVIALRWDIKSANLYYCPGGGGGAWRGMKGGHRGEYELQCRHIVHVPWCQEEERVFIIPISLYYKKMFEIYNQVTNI